MYQPARLAVAVFALCLPLLLVVPVAGRPDDDEYKRLYTTPEKPIEFWTAIQVELDRGSYEVAGKWLRALIAKKPGDKDLLEIADKDGTIAVMRLRNVRNWTSDPKATDATIKEAEKRVAQAKADKEGRPQAETYLKLVTLNVNTMKDAETLIESVQGAVRRRAGDAGYIKALIAQLRATREEKAFAIRELNSKVGALAVPYMLEDFSKSTDSEERLVLRQALEVMGDRAIAPLLAGLDGYPLITRLEIIDLLRRKFASSASQIVPFLWFSASNPTEDVTVRNKARQLLSEFTSTPIPRLIPAKVALTREAEKYYRKEVSFNDPTAVSVWRWDAGAKTVVVGWPGVPLVTASQAEEYYGMRFARQALEIDSEFVPAQVAFLSLALQKTGEKYGLSKPVSSVVPALGEQLSKAKVELLLEVLDRALLEDKPNVAIPVLQSLGLRGEVRAKRPLSKGEPPLVRALYSPDLRIRMAAVRAFVTIPGESPPHARKRVLDILGHILTPAAAYLSGRKVLVAVADEGWRTRTQQSVIDLGAAPVSVTSGRDVMRAMRGNADIEAVLLESTLPTPGLAHLLAQMRADIDISRIPIVVAAVPETREALEAASQYREMISKKDVLDQELRELRVKLADLDAREDAEKREYVESPSLTRSERMAQFTKIEDKYRELRKQAELSNPGIINALRRSEQVEKIMNEAARRYNMESEIREAALLRFVARYPHITVVPISTFMNASTLAPTILSAEEKVTTLSAEDRAQMIDTAVELLRDMAVGRIQGYDVQPLTGVILDTLKAGRLKPEGQERVIEIAARLPGSRPQQELAAVTLAGSRSLPVRLAAAKALLSHRQRYGALLPPSTVSALLAESAKPETDPLFKQRLDLVSGAYSAEPRTTGERLRDFNPPPVASPMAPPPAPKKDD
ncbi:MAG: hypothetical protein EBV06_01720 [Planctomycetia bacterium]|nr:hypothetical protein [Planctomycetia bacterium]